MSSGCGSRPAIMPENPTLSAIAVMNSALKSGSSRSSAHGGVVSSTSWPSEASSSPVSRAAAT